ncbi:MAG: hypothetical protein VX255_09235 [Candidatus Latescibacterota bacterium]|nr:hypothetical protein [Candidatus Latescibacterota bacterium]
MSDTERIEQLRHTIQEEEKRFLMDRYVTLLLGHVEDDDEEELDDRTVESLLVSRPYVSEILANKIAEVLENAGHEVEDIEREDADGDEAIAHAEANGAENGGENGRQGNGQAGPGDGAEDFAATLDGEDVGPDADDSDTIEVESDAVGLFDDEEEGESDGASASEEAEDEEGGIFDNDIYSGNEGDSGAEGEEGAPGFEPTVGHEAEDTPGFEPTKGHEVEETPGFEPTVGHEAEDTPGFTPTKGHDVEETPGFTPTEGHETEDTPGFTPTEGEDNRKKKKDGPGFTANGEPEDKSVVGRRPGVDVPEEERLTRMRKKEQPQASEEEEEAYEELNFDLMTHQVSLEDLEQYLGMQILPNDREKLELSWQKKTRDPNIRTLVANEKAMEHPYALIPRLPRFFKGGAVVQANMLNLVRNYPQLFDDVGGLINKYRTEAFFVGETPDLDWSIVACEALPNSLNRNYMEQKTVVKQYAQQNQTNERRIQRRRLIEILYDAIVINVVTKEMILEKTVDLSDSNVGRQNFACVNYGDKGIRINDVGRQQRHQQMGMCPSW